MFHVERFRKSLINHLIAIFGSKIVLFCMCGRCSTWNILVSLLWESGYDFLNRQAPGVGEWRRQRPHYEKTDGYGISGKYLRVGACQGGGGIGGEVEDFVEAGGEDDGPDGVGGGGEAEAGGAIDRQLAEAEELGVLELLTWVTQERSSTRYGHVWGLGGLTADAGECLRMCRGVCWRA